MAHIKSMLSDSAKVIVYGALPVQMDSLLKLLHTQNINSIPLIYLQCSHAGCCIVHVLSLALPDVEFVQAPFSYADSTSEALADVSTIICLPPSSLSTVTQPLDFIQQEGGVDHNHCMNPFGHNFKCMAAYNLCVLSCATDHCAPLLLSEKMSLSTSMPREQRDTLVKALTCKPHCHN